MHLNHNTSYLVTSYFILINCTFLSLRSRDQVYHDLAMFSPFFEQYEPNVCFWFSNHLYSFKVICTFPSLKSRHQVYHDLEMFSPFFEQYEPNEFVHSNWFHDPVSLKFRKSQINLSCLQFFQKNPNKEKMSISVLASRTDQKKLRHIFILIKGN